MEQSLAGQFKEYAYSLQEELVTYRHHLHSHPELSFEEYATQEYIKKILANHDVDEIIPVAGTGLIATITGQTNNGPVVILRADMDALPVQEKNNNAYVSIHSGKMHACGHDVHMTSLLGALKILRTFQEWHGKLVLLFQPGEEKFPGGAIEVIKSGMLHRLQPSVIIGQHVEPAMETGTVGYRPGKYMASSDEIFCTIKGRGGHAALPAEVDQTTIAASRLITHIYDDIHNHQPGNVPTIIAFGRIIAEGATNVIPDQVSIEGTFRTMDESWRKEAHRIIKDRARDIARQYGVICDTTINYGYPVLSNHPEAVTLAKALSVAYLDQSRVLSLDVRMTSEDFAYYSEAFPSLFFRLGVKKPGEKTIRKLHSSFFDIDEKALVVGAGHLAWLAYHFLNNKKNLF
jgi:amidohydrolase